MSERRTIPTWLMALMPLVLLAALVVLFLRFNPVSAFEQAFPPVEELTIPRVVLSPGDMTLQVVNGGPDSVTIAQVLVDEAYWDHTIEPARTIARLGRATIRIPYPWVEGEAHVVKLITSTGITFEKEIAVAVASPQPSAQLVGLFALLGTYVGVLPVALGLLWLPALKQARPGSVSFFMFLTVGLLLFLGFDALAEAFELAPDEELIPGAYQGMGLLLIGLVGSFVMLSGLEKVLIARARSASALTLTLAFMVAVGIGLHNFSEGLAIGSSYALGNLSLGGMLVVGFALHNTTEGLAIVAPLAQSNVRMANLILLGAIAGVPTIPGAWIGGFTYSPTWALLFLAIGAGAIFQVAWQITMQMVEHRNGSASLLTIGNAFGLLAGLLVMYVTGLFVAV